MIKNLEINYVTNKKFVHRDDIHKLTLLWNTMFRGKKLNVDYNQTAAHSRDRCITLRFWELFQSLVQIYFPWKTERAKVKLWM